LIFETLSPLPDHTQLFLLSPPAAGYHRLFRGLGADAAWRGAGRGKR
jgi:hypothetical protein